MPIRRIRHAGLTVIAVAALAFAGLATPAAADILPPDVPESWKQEPRATEGIPSPLGSRAWTAPGGAATPGEFTLSPGAMNAETATRVTRLDSVLPKSGVQNLLTAANRTAVSSCVRDPFGTAPDPDIGYCLQNDDSISREWVPPGLHRRVRRAGRRVVGQRREHPAVRLLRRLGPGPGERPEPGDR